jgi:predicted secreted protein
MARLSGKIGSASLGGAILGVNSWEIDYKGEAIDVTGMDSAAAKAFIGGLTEWSGSLEGFLESGATLPLPAATAAVSLVDSADAGFNTYTGSSIITGVKYSTSVEGAVKYSITFQGTAALGIA